jgi:hypothetical protein
MVVQCPVGVSVSGIVIEVRVCGSDSVGIVEAVLWRFQCNRVRSRSNGEDIMVVWCPVRRLSIVRRDRSCMLEQWATIHRINQAAHSSSLLPLSGDRHPLYPLHHSCGPLILLWCLFLRQQMAQRDLFAAQYCAGTCLQKGGEQNLSHCHDSARNPACQTSISRSSPPFPSTPTNKSTSHSRIWSTSHARTLGGPKNQQRRVLEQGGSQSSLHHAAQQ